MNKLVKNRIARIFRLPTLLLLLAVSAGFASVGQAQEIPTIVITAERPEKCESLLTMRSEARGTEIRTDAARAIWKTRVSVATDLSAKLNDKQRPFRIAGKYTDKRG